MTRSRLTHSPLALLTAGLVCGLLSSCQPGGKPDPHTRVNIPNAWKTSLQGSSGKISSGWLRDFNDPRLTRLVKEAQANNPNLLATAERLKAARASVVRSRSSRIPSASLSAGGSRTHNGSSAGSSRYSGGKNLGVSASWELDLWGRLKHLHSASSFDYQATAADFRSTRLSLAANTASLWYNLISSENQVKLATETLSSYRKVEKIIERNYKAGTARALELQLSRNNVFSAERILQARKRNRDDARRNLEVLLGRYPSAALTAPTSLPSIRKDVPTGLPADLIARRPDLVQARLRLLSSFHRAHASQKNLLPTLRLTGNSGASSSTFSNLLNPSYLSSSISASLGQSLFEAGAKREDARAAVARNRAAVHDYSNIALRAFREVESALASEQSLKKQEHFLRKELQQAALAEKQAERDYAEGVDGVDILDLLESQRRASNARSSLIDLQNQRIQNRINLHLALGGDFSTQ
ncbi:MAG: efflux transporter outer membrane subunit [Akkermansiaceae bacterium]